MFSTVGDKVQAADEYASDRIVPAIHHALTQMLDVMPETDHTTEFVRYLRESGERQRDVIYSTAEPKVIEVALPLEALKDSRSEIYLKYSMDVCAANESEEVNSKIPLTIQLLPRGKKPFNPKVASGTSSHRGTPGSQVLSPPNTQLESSLDAITPSKTGKTVKYALPSTGAEHASHESVSIPSFTLKEAKESPIQPVAAAALKSSTDSSPCGSYVLPRCCQQTGSLPLYGLYCPNKEDLETTFLYIRHVTRVTKNITLLFLLQNETVFIDKVPYAGNKWKATCQQYGVNIAFRPFEEAVQSAVLDERMSSEGRSIAHHDCDTLDDILESLELKAGVTSTNLRRIYCPDLAEYPHTFLQFAFVNLLTEIIVTHVTPHAPDAAVVVVDFSSNRLGLGLVQSCLATALYLYEDRFITHEVLKEELGGLDDDEDDGREDDMVDSSISSATMMHPDFIKTLDFKTISERHSNLVMRREKRDAIRAAAIAKYRRDMLTPDISQEHLAKLHNKVAVMQQIVLDRASRRQVKDESFRQLAAECHSVASVAIQAQIRARLVRKKHSVSHTRQGTKPSGTNGMLEALTQRQVPSTANRHVDGNLSNLDTTSNDNIQSERYNVRGTGALFAQMRLVIRELLSTYTEALTWDPPHQPCTVTRRAVQWSWRTARIPKANNDDTCSEDEEINFRVIPRLTLEAKSSLIISKDPRYIDAGEKDTMYVNTKRKRPPLVDPYRTVLNLMRQSNCDLTEHFDDITRSFAGCAGMQAKSIRLLKSIIHLVLNASYLSLRASGNTSVTGRTLEEWLGTCHGQLLKRLENFHFISMCVPKSAPPEVLRAGPSSLSTQGSDWTVISAASLPEGASLPWRTTSIVNRSCQGRTPREIATSTFITTGNLTARSDRSAAGSDLANANYISDEAKSNETAALGFSFFHHAIPIFAFYEPMETKAMREMAQRVSWYTGCTWISTTKNLVVYVNDAPYAFVNRAPYPEVIVPPLAKIHAKVPQASSLAPSPPKDAKTIVGSPSNAGSPLSPKPPQERLARLASIRVQPNGQPLSPDARLGASGILARKSSEIRSSSSLRRRQRKSGNEEAQVVDDLNMLSLGATEVPQCDTNIPIDEVLFLNEVSWQEAERQAAATLKAAGNPATGKADVFIANGCGDTNRRGACTLEGCELSPSSVQVFDPVVYAAVREAERLKVLARPEQTTQRNTTGDVCIPLYVQPVRRRSKPEVMFVGEMRVAAEEVPLEDIAASSTVLGSSLSVLQTTQTPTIGRASTVRGSSISGSQATEPPPPSKLPVDINVRSYSDACKDHILRRHPLEGTFSRMPTHLGTDHMVESMSAIVTKCQEAMRSASIGIGIDTPDNLPLLAAALITWCVKHGLCDTILEEINEQLNLTERYTEYGEGAEGESMRARSVGSSSAIVHIFNLKNDGSLANVSQSDLTTLRSGGRNVATYTVMTNAPVELRPLPLIDTIYEHFASDINAAGADLNESRAFVDALLMRTNLSSSLKNPISDMAAFVEDMRQGAVVVSEQRERFLLQKRILETTRTTEKYVLLLLLHIFLTSKYNGKHKAKTERDRKASTSSTASAASSPKRHSSNPPVPLQPIVPITFSEFMRTVPFAGKLVKDIDIFMGLKPISAAYLRQVFCADRDEFGLMSGTSSPDTASILEMAPTSSQLYLPDPHHALYSNVWNRWASSENYVHKML